MRKPWIAIAIIAGCLSTAGMAEAEELAWKKEWPKFRPAEIAFASGETLQVAASVTIWHKPTLNFRNPSYDRRCAETSRLNESNVSGHTAISFTGAALTCAHHLHLPLYGGGAPDTIVCVAAMSIATAQGMLRIHSDNHYATDVLLGASLGIASGYVMPRLLHYRSSGGRMTSLLPTFHSRELGATAVLAPSLTPDTIGVTLGGAI